MRPKPTGSRGRCPDEMTLAAYADGRLGDDSRTEVEVHLADCGACLDQIAFLVEMERQGQPAETRSQVSMPQVPRPEMRPVGYRQPGRRRLTRYLAPIAAVLLISLIAYDVWPPTHSQQHPVESGETRLLRSTQEEASIEVLAPRPESAVEAVFDFEFAPQDGAEWYFVWVVSEEGEPVWRSQSSSHRGQIPQEAGLEPGHKYFLQVEARGRQGQRWRSSFIPFRVAP
ncbi:MAG TPA: zf-HC2 domain-containing protein [Acidobacteriota bacterium]|nr:zf-HC2 domain-containing protein [Acidobacteriota bacterium]